jgi:hypothetical protein
MDKRTFFETLDTQLAEKYHLTIHQINTIRSAFLGYNQTRKEIAEWCAMKLAQPASSARRKEVRPDSKHRKFNRDHYQILLNFVASCSLEAWDDINQVTEFDKKPT